MIRSTTSEILSLWAGETVSFAQIKEEEFFDARDTKPSSWWWLALSVGALFACKFALLMVDGAVFGRIAMPPVYDDVSYFVDALLRLNILQRFGMADFALGLWRNPPHAPYSTAAAIVAFAVAGPWRGAAYFMNAVAAFLITCFWLRMFRVSLGLGVLLAVILITTRWFDEVITVFHPDLITGYGAAVVASALVFQNEVLTSLLRTLAVGVAAGLVLLIKPVAFPVSLLVFGIAWLVGAVASFLSTGSSAIAFRRLVIGLSGIILVAGPYYWQAFFAILTYLRLGFVDQADIWSLQLSPLGHALFFLKVIIRYLGAWFFVALVAISAAILVARQRNRRILVLQFAGLVLCALIGYAIPSVTPIKRDIFGAFFYGVVLVLLFCSMLYLDRSLPELITSGHPGRNAVIALVLIATFSFRDAQGRFPLDAIADGQRAYNGLYRIISQQRQLRQSGLSPPVAPFRVFIPIPSPVPIEAFLYRSLTVDDLPLIISASIDARNLAVLTGDAAKADIVVVQDASLASKVYQYPAVALLGDLRDKLADYGFSKIGSVSLADGELIAYAHPATKSANHSAQ